MPAVEDPHAHGRHAQPGRARRAVAGGALLEPKLGRSLEPGLHAALVSHRHGVLAATPISAHFVESLHLAPEIEVSPKFWGGAGHSRDEYEYTRTRSGSGPTRMVAQLARQHSLLEPLFGMFSMRLPEYSRPRDPGRPTRRTAERARGSAATGSLNRRDARGRRTRSVTKRVSLRGHTYIRTIQIHKRANEPRANDATRYPVCGINIVSGARPGRSAFAGFEAT